MGTTSKTQIPMKKNLVIGLTGGIACGKNTVAEMLQSFGAYVIDADLIAHQLLKDDPSVKREVITTFGESILGDEGEIDRPKLGRMVFGRPDLLRALNEIVHPPVVETMMAEIERHRWSDEHAAIVVNVPLLMEANLTYMVDSVVLVYADEDVQIQRLAQRGLSKADAQKRIRSQMPFSEKTPFADFIIHNSGHLSDTTEQVKQVWEALVGRECGSDL